MKNWMKRSFSLLLALVMIVGFVPLNLLVSAAENNLDSAAGIVWLVKAESGSYAPASDELISLIMGEKLDDMIRDAVGKTKNDDTIIVKYDGMNVGSLSNMMSNFQKLNAMRTEIVDAISNHKLVKFNIGGTVMEVAFRNYANAKIVFAEDGNLYVEAGADKPATLAQLRELVKESLNDVNKVYVELAGRTTLDKAGCVTKINVKMEEWPGIGEAPVKIGEVTVSLTPDDVTDADPVEVKANVYIRDSREEYTVTYKVNGASESFVVYEGTKTPATTLINAAYYNVTWDKAIADTVTGDVTYTATSVTVKDPAYDKDGDGKDDREQSYLVTYWNSDLTGTVLPPFEMPYGSQLEHPDDPAYGANGTFLGWRLLDENGNKTNNPAPMFLTGDIECYPVWSETPKIKVIFNDRGTKTEMFFDIAADGTIDDMAAMFEIHPLTGVYSSGFYQIAANGEDLNKDGIANEVPFGINTLYSGGDVYIDFYTDDNHNGKQDAVDPQYDIYVGKWNSSAGEVVMVKAETWMLSEKLPATIGKDAIGAYAPDGEFNYNPGLFGYAISGWTVEWDDVNNKGTVKPVLGVDTNGNGKIDSEESTVLDIKLPFAFPYTVAWTTNDDGQYMAVITFDLGGESYFATIEVSELAAGGRFIYNASTTEIKVSPIMMGDEIGFYVDDVTIQAAGEEATSVVAGYDENYYAYNKVAAVEAVAAVDVDMVLSIVYKEAPTLVEKHPLTPPQLDPSEEYPTEEELFNLLVDGAAYDEEAVEIWYLSRVLAEKDRKVTVKLDGLKAYIESRFGAVLDILPVDFEFPESMTVTLPAEQWTRFEESPERDMLSAQAVADEYINRKIKEIEDSGFDTSLLLPLATEMVADLTTEIQAKAMIHRFGQVYPENGNPNDVYEETLRIDYTTKKYAKSLQTKLFTYDPDRIPVELKVVNTKVSYDYACVSDADLLKNVKLINKLTGKEITGVQLVLDRIDYYDDVNAGTYKVKVTFQGDTTYKAATSAAEFTLVINKVVPQISIDSMVITADDNYDYKAQVTPGNAPIVQIIAGIESGEFELDENMALVDKDVSAKVYVKIPDMYAKFLDGLTIEGYPTVNLGQFYDSDELRALLEEYAEGRDLPGKDAINTVHAIMDLIPEVLNSLEPYEIGLEKVNYLVRIDAVSDNVRPTAPGIYVNFAASMGYIGQLLEQMGHPAAGLFENDNYIIGDMPSLDLSQPDDFNKIKNMCADAGIVIYTPMIPVPNSGGIQLYDEKGINKAENVYVYSYDGTPVEHALKVAYKGAELAGAEPYYYGLTTAFDPTTEAPSVPGIYIAAYTYTEKDPANPMEIRRIGSDAAVIIIKQREADLTITGGSFEYDGTSKFPEISVTDKNGNEISGAGKTIISGTVNVKTQGTNVTANDLYGAVNIDFPDGLTIPYLNIDGVPARIEDAWNYYRIKILNKAENDKITPSDFIDFLEFCADKTEAAANKAVATFEKVGANRYVQSALNKINNNVSADLSQDNLFSKVYRLQDMLHNGRVNYFDALIAQLRPLEALDDNVWITMKDLEDLDYSNTGIYFYMGAVTDPELTLSVGKGVVIIHSDDEYIMHDTYVPYDGKEHSIIIQDETNRDEITFILERADDGIVAISKDKKVLNIQLDRELAEKLIAELNTVMDVVTDEYEILDVIGRDLSVDTDFYVGSVYKKANGVADKLTEKILNEIYKLASEKLTAKYPGAAGTINEALDAALGLVEEKLTAMYPVLLAKLEAIDTLDSDAKIVISSYLPIDVAQYEVTKFSFNTDEINILLDSDVISALNSALNKVNAEQHTNLKLISDGSSGYVLTGYEKAADALEIITGSVFAELEKKLQKAINAIPDISKIVDVDAKAEAQKLLNKLLDQQDRLVRWENELLERMAANDGLNDYTRIVINGQLPVEVGTYDFYGFDYDIARSSATLVIEPIYVQVSVDEGQWKYYGNVVNDLLTTVKYYSYKTNPTTLTVEEVEITDAKLIAGAKLTYDVVCDAAKDPYAEVGEYPITIENEKIVSSENYVLVESIDGVFTVKQNDFVVQVISTHTYDGTVQNVEYIITVDGKKVDKNLFVIEGELSGTNAGAYTFTVTAKPESGYTGSVQNMTWNIAPAVVTSVEVIGTYTYDGTEQTAQLVVKAGDLIVDTYDILVGNTGKNAGDYTVWVQGTGNFTGLASCDWTIAPADITEIVLTNGNTFYYMDAEQTVAYTVNAGSLTNLVEGTDFDLDAAINAVKGTDAGDYTFKVIGTGNFTGEASATWFIIPAEVKVTAENKTMKMNDAAVPTLTYTVEYINGYVAPEKLAVTLVTDPAVNAAGQYVPGEYAITASAVDTANWTITVVDAVLTVEEMEFICWNVQTGVYYDDVTDALEEAIGTGATIQMLNDATAAYNGKNEAIIIVYNGLTLDLNGHYVEAANLLSYGIVMDRMGDADADADVACDTASQFADNGLTTGGILISSDTTKAWTQIQTENGGYLPVYDAETGSYKFFSYGIQRYQAVTTSNQRGTAAQFRFRLKFHNGDAYRIIANGGSGVEMVVRLYWDGLLNEIIYTMDATTVTDYAAAAYQEYLAGDTYSQINSYMYLTVGGVDLLSSGQAITAKPTVTTGTDAGLIGGEMVYTVR